MTSASPSHSNHTGKAHATRRVPLAMNGHAPDQPANQANGAQRAKEHPAPLTPHVKRHIPFGVASNTEIARTVVQADARLCRKNFGAFCRLVWPHKTAENLGLAVGCSTRAAAYEISGEREPSAKSLHVMAGKLLE